MEGIIGILGLLFGIYQFFRTQRFDKENNILQKKLVKFQENTEQEKSKEIATIKVRKKTEIDIYREHIQQKFKYLDFTGLNAILQKPLQLEKIYVKLCARPSYRLPQYKTISDFNVLDDEKLKEAHEEFADVFNANVQQAKNNREPLKMVILGHPGSGKTTLMKWIALQCTNEDYSIFSDFLPVFIALKDLGREPDKTFRNKNIQTLTLDYLEKENISTTFFADSFENNKIMFLLDGLDEIADESIRREVITWIEKQSIRKSTLLITSRFSGIQEARGLKFQDAIPVFSIQSFDIADIERFLENWYQNIEVAVMGEDNKEDSQKAIQKGQSGYESLINIIKNPKYKTLRVLAINPLLLTIIAIVHRTRAYLPKERHKLYDECLKVMIELWNVANRKLDISFSVDNSISNISKIAVFLMKKNKREIEMTEILSLLPPKIEHHPVEYFLKEMVLKAGLLYKSEGKYGFLHLTFQEYLTAWYYATRESAQEILIFRDKDYWTETYKLYVNIANPRHLFNEIIDNLIEKNYWKQMPLWDECLADIVVEDNQEEIEVKFAEKILRILPDIENGISGEELIVQLYAHYPLFKHASKFKDLGWNLFLHAKHPFVQSVGSSILSKCDKKTQEELMIQLKRRVTEFEEHGAEAPASLLDFILKNNNTFVLLIEGRRNLMDFYFALEKRKKRNSFIIYLAIYNLSNLSFHLTLYDLREFLELEKIQKILELNELRSLIDLRDIIDFRDIRDNLDLRGILALQDIVNKYKDKYAQLIAKHRKEIENWMDHGIKKLHSLSDEELLEYFPQTSSEDLRVFRESMLV